MKMTGTFIFLGIDSFTGTKDPTKVYKNAVFLQETDTLKVFLDSESEKVLNGIQLMDKVDTELDIRFGQKIYITLTAVRKLSTKVA